jgi:hypothetical protein
MLLSKPYLPTISFQQHNGQAQSFASSRPRHIDDFYGSAQQNSSFANNELDFDIETDLSAHSISPSPVSTQSFPSQYSSVQASLGGFDNIRTIAVPRGLQAQQTAPFKFASDAPCLFGQADLMHADSWLSTGPLTPRSATRFSSQHHRESSQSSLGSAGPASPHAHSTSNPHIAVADASGDGFHGLPTAEDFNNYQLTPNSKPFSGQDTFYPNYPHYTPVDAASHAAYSQHAMASNRQQKSDSGLLPTPDVSGSNQSRPKPVSVASSIAGDSPITPVGEHDESGRRRKNGEPVEPACELSKDTLYSLSSVAAFNAIPKLDRTMTDIYGDELFNPNFTVTSASPSHVTVSPSNEVFAQRLQTANSQHLSAVHSPVSSTSHGSPFRQGSPLAPTPSHDFPSSGSSAPMVFGSSQQLREQRKAAQDAQAMQQQLAHDSNISTPQTISPQDALIEYDAPEGEAHLPLFPQQGAPAPFNVEHLKGVSQAPQSFNNLPIEGSPFGNYVAAQLPQSITGHQQQYSFVSQAGQGHHQQQGNTAPDTVSRPSSAESGQSEFSHGSTGMQRPLGTAADGGTYTCTYHGCTLRFDTPALLQKHKREGHRNAHGLAAPRRPEPVSSPGMTSNLLNSQAGPHKCDRINPSTGKPCNIQFSRPYDLTRHEDTIHNARKQKVRCNLCTDEKTFSRADALTRHYRVCHPHVEFPGKHRRRGGHS